MHVMFKTLPLVGASALLLAACGTVEPQKPQALSTAPAPVSYDGHVAGEATDYVFVLVPDSNPATPGLAMKAGESLQLALSPAFKRNASVPIVADRDTNLVLTKGWPQGAVPLAGQYRVDYVEKDHALTVTALKDIAADGGNAPGIKVIHVRGRSFTNPASGGYPVTVTRRSAEGRVQAVWQGDMRVQEEMLETRLAPTNFHVPPGSNTEFQKVATGQVAPMHLGLLLWGADGAPLNGVGVGPRDINRFPRYTGGLLLQDSNGDRRLDLAVDTVVGGIIGAAPKGAMGQAATSPQGADGNPVLSGQVPRSDRFPPAAGGGKPNPGLLAIQFRAGSLPGLYRPTVELLKGNSYQFTVEAR